MYQLMLDLAHIAPAVATAFFASAVEAVEAATIVLAAGITRGWRSSLCGAVGALVLLGAIVAAFGTAIAAIPIAILQVAVGALLLLFGLRWLRKAMLRYAGVIDMRDEAALFDRQRGILGAANARGWDPMGAIVSFKAVLLEGIEVIVIVIGIGAAGGLLVPAALGAAAACVLVAAIAGLLHRPLARVPENALKFVVGVMVSAFGLFWYGEGIGIQWPHGDAAIPALMAVVLLAAGIGIAAARR